MHPSASAEATAPPVSSRSASRRRFVTGGPTRAARCAATCSGVPVRVHRNLPDALSGEPVERMVEQAATAEVQQGFGGCRGERAHARAQAGGQQKWRFARTSWAAVSPGEVWK